MKSSLWMTLLVFGLVIGLAGCKSKREEAMEGTVDVMEDFVDQLSKIKSNADVVDAKPKLEKIGARMKDQGKKMDELGEPSAEEREKLEKKYKPRMEKVQARLMDEIGRLAKAGIDLSVLDTTMGGMGPRWK